MSKLLYSATTSIDGFIAGPGGGGVRLFDRPGGTPPALERLGTTSGPVATDIRLRVVR
ncbi:hypothetical protein [Rhodococcus ruber]|uniref:hypothetical protein n=1 Tax=Rhodococcus ruber TaxID=1830 RepID=UPI00034D941B|nr:hypothetical protein [Rhodococcus ruber]